MCLDVYIKNTYFLFGFGINSAGFLIAHMTVFIGVSKQSTNDELCHFAASFNASLKWKQLKRLENKK